MAKRRFKPRHHREHGPLTGLLWGLVVLIAAAASGLWWWNPWYVGNTWRLITTGWITTVDRALVAPDATDVYAPLERVTGLPTPTPLPRNVADPERFATAIDYAGRMQSYSQIIWHAGAVVLERTWPGSSADSRPDGASMHKSIIALAIGAAVADGTIGSVDDPVEKYVSEWRNSSKGKITIRNLLQMSSGLGTFSTDGG